MSDATATSHAPGLAICLPLLDGATVLALGDASASETLQGFGNVVSGAGGRVQLSGSASLTTISLGDGADCISLDGALNTVVLGNGDVTVHATGGGATVHGMSPNPQSCSRAWGAGIAGWSSCRLSKVCGSSKFVPAGKCGAMAHSGTSTSISQ